MTGPAAVVIGLDTIIGLQVTRVLATRGVPVIGIATTRDHYCAKTRHVERVIEAPTSGTGLVDALRTLVTESDEGPVLFPCHDPAVRTVSAHRTELLPARVLLPDHSVVLALSDKATFDSRARDLGFRTPRTWSVSDERDLGDAIDEIAFPAILKPTFRDQRWQNSGMPKGFVVHDPAELRATYDEASGASDDFVAQEWVPGPHTAQFTCNALFGADGDVRGTFVSRKVRQWPIETGVGSMGVGVLDPEVEAMTTGLFKSFGFRGLAYLEIKRDPRDGGPVIIEPNVGRPTGRGALADHCGVDLLYGMYREAIGRPLPDLGTQQPSKKTWVHLRADVQAGLSEYRNEDTTLRQWLRSYRPPLVDAVWSVSDPAPMGADLLRSLKIAMGLSRRARSGR